MKVPKLTDPQPDEVTDSGTCTLVWRCILEPMEHFECKSFYTLEEI